MIVGVFLSIGFGFKVKKGHRCDPFLL